MNNFAISSKGVGDALIRSASALAAANNTLDESIALATAMNSTVQNPEKVGNALKTLAAYLRSSKVELEELGETGELIATTTPKLHEKMVALTHGSVQILERDGVTLRSTYDIMRDLSKIWDTGFLTDVEQAAILEMIAGKRQSSTVASLLQNFTTAEEVLAAAAQSAGSAVRENEKYLDSVNGKIAQFKASFEQLSATVMSSAFVKNSYTFLTNLVNVINDLMSASNGLGSSIGALISIAGGAMTAMSSNPLFRLWSTSSTGGLSFTPGTYLSTLGDAFQTNSELTHSLGFIREYNTAVAAGADITQKFASEIAGSNESLAGYFASLKGGMGSVQGYSAYLKEAGHSLDIFNLKTAASTVFVNLLNTALNAMIIFAVTAAINAIIKKIDEWNHRLDTAIDKTDKLNSEWEDFQQTNKDNIKTVEGLKDEFEELSKGVDENGKNVSLTAEQYDRYKDIVSTLIEISPTLVKGYNDERDAIIDKNTAIEKTIELLKEQDRVEKMRRSTTEYLTELFGGYGATVQKDRETLSGAEANYNAARASFITGRNNQLTLQQAQAILRSLGLNTSTLTGMLVEPPSVASRRAEGVAPMYIDGKRFAAEFMDEIVANIDTIDPKLLGYDDFYDMQEAYRTVVVAEQQIKQSRELVDSTLEDITKAFYPGVESLEGWTELPAAARQAVYDYIDEYITNYRQVFTPNWAGDLVPDQSKISEINSKFIGVAMEMLDDATTALVNQLSEARTQRNEGLISQQEYRGIYDRVMGAMKSSGVNSRMVGIFEEEFDPSKIVSGLQKVTDAATEADVAVQSVLETLSVDANGLAAAFDFSNAITSIDKLGDSFSGIADALLIVRDGTMLTEQEIANLITQYPELASAANLYAADTIEGQQAILEHFMETKEAQYNAEIDTDIARLTAQQSLLEQQIAAEDSKLTAIAGMRAQMEENSLKSAQAYQEGIDEINAIGAENFATIKDGEVAYNADALSRMLANDTTYAEKSETDAWEPHADDIADDVNAAYEAASTMLDNLLTAESAALANFRDNTLVPFSNDMAKAMQGEKVGSGAYNAGYGAGKHYTKINPRHQGTTVKKSDLDEVFEIAPGVTIFDDITDKDKKIAYDAVSKKITQYLDLAEQTANQNKKMFEAELESIRNQISTLNSMKVLDLPAVYGKAPSTKSSGSKGTSGSGSKGSGSGSSAKEAKTVEEYKADIDAYYAAEKKLAEVQFKRAQLEKQLEDATELKDKIAIERELIDVYQEESDAQAEIVRLKEETIEQNMRALEQLGFEVSYNKETNQLYIDNLEHLNELVADSKGDYETIEEATNEVRKTTEALIQSTEKLAEDCGQAGESMYNLKKDTKEAQDQIVAYLNEMVEKANEVVDGFQNIYDTFTQAAKEYSSSGFLSVDSLQSILQLGPKYLQLLYDEAGQLTINKERIQDIIAARSREMAVKTAYVHVQKILKALEDDDDETLRELVKVTKDFTDETWGSVYALAAKADTLAKLNGKGDMFEFSVTDQVRMIESSYQTMISSMDEYWKSVEDGYTTQKDALQDVIDQAIEYYKWENEKKSDALEKEKDDFKDIIEKRKEALRLAKEEDKRNADVEDKLREIAKLQRKIDQLSLDDSREARAQKASLEEELYQLQKGIAEEQNEASVSAAEDALDKQYDAFEKEKDKEIKALGKEMQSYQKLYDRAIAELSDDWKGLYQKILDYNHEYGTDLDKNVIAKWEQAAKAVERYGSVRDAVEGVKSDKYFGDYQTPEYAKYEQTVMEAARTAAVSMKANSIAWLTASKDARPDIEKENERLGYGAGMTKVNGAWYMPNGERAYKLTAAEYTQPLLARIAVDVAKLAMVQDEAERKRIQDEIEYFKKTLADMKAMEKFHTGGIVGDYKSLKQNEVMAVLQKGEAVLDKQKENALYKLVDFAALLQKKLGTSIDTGLLGMLTRSAVPAIPRATAYAAGAAGGVNFAPSITVEINHSGSLNEADAQRYGNIAADAALDKLSDAFGRRGITNFGNSLLKGAQS